MLGLSHPALFQVFKPVVTTGDGSCLFNALSLTLTGTETCSDLLRLLVVHALVKHKDTMLSALLDAYPTRTPAQINGGFNSAVRTAVNYRWGTDYHIFALSLLLDRPIFQYNTDPNHNLPLTDSVELFSQRFLSFQPGTRCHLVYCTNVH